MFVIECATFWHDSKQYGYYKKYSTRQQQEVEKWQLFAADLLHINVMDPILVNFSFVEL